MCGSFLIVASSFWTLWPHVVIPPLVRLWTIDVGLLVVATVLVGPCGREGIDVLGPSGTWSTTREFSEALICRRFVVARALRVEFP